MKRDQLKVTVLCSQIPQDFLTRVKLDSIDMNIGLIDFIGE